MEGRVPVYTTELKDKKEKPATVPPDYIHWAHSWKEAMAEAKERNVPIHVAFHKDN